MMRTSLLAVSLALMTVGAVAEPQGRPESFHGPDGMTGLLYRPATGVAPSAAVLIVHDTLGLDLRSRSYIAQLTGAGLLVLEVELSANPPDGTTPPFPGEIGAAELVSRAAAWLARDVRVDPARIGALGFGIGARAVLLTAPIGAAHDPFSARMLLYPGCDSLRDIVRDRNRSVAPSLSPILLLYGGEDPANLATDCEDLAAWLGGTIAVERVRYRDATYAWDLPQSGGGDTTGQPWPRGYGTVRAVAWPELAELTAARSASFFLETLSGHGARRARCVSQDVATSTRWCSGTE
jgi:dienelactone hydrolase